LPFEQRNDRHLPHRAGHVHAGVYLVLVMLRYVDEAVLSPFWKWLARVGALFLAAAVLSLGVGLIRAARRMIDDARSSRDSKESR
jgi:hypothetical protein